MCVFIVRCVIVNDDDNIPAMTQVGHGCDALPGVVWRDFAVTETCNTNLRQRTNV